MGAGHTTYNNRIEGKGSRRGKKLNYSSSVFISPEIKSDNQWPIGAVLNSCCEVFTEFTFGAAKRVRTEQSSYCCWTNHNWSASYSGQTWLAVTFATVHQDHLTRFGASKIELEGFHFRFGVCGLQMKGMKDRTQKSQMDSPLSPAPSASPGFKEDLIEGNTGRSMQAYDGSIFSKQQGRRASSETVVALFPALTLSSLARSICCRLRGKAFSPPSMLCISSYASCMDCQERAGTLKEQVATEQHVWHTANLKVSMTSENSLNNYTSSVSRKQNV